MGIIVECSLTNSLRVPAYDATTTRWLALGNEFSKVLPSFWLLGLFFSFLISAVGAGSAQQTTPDLKGTWSGTFISRNADVSPFTITVKINLNSGGRLIGDASLISDCLKNHHLEVTVSGSNIVLAGSDPRGDTVSFSGTIDNSGTLLTLDYIINGSPSARCEIDNGTGTMAKR